MSDKGQTTFHPEMQTELSKDEMLKIFVFGVKHFECSDRTVMSVRFGVIEETESVTKSFGIESNPPSFSDETSLVGGGGAGPSWTLC
jgi:hypothetical protein